MQSGAHAVHLNALIDAAACRGVPLSQFAKMRVWDAIDDLPQYRAEAAEALHWLDKRALDKAREWSFELRAQKILVLPRWHPLYPKRALSLGRAAPALLFVKGAIELLAQPAVAIVGARGATNAGLYAAHSLGAYFAQEGYTVVSGGAKGVDGAAHDATLESGGCMAVVLPFGLNHLDWTDNIRHYVRDKHLVILSAYPPDHAWEDNQALERNGLIAALAQLVCIVEPASKGGSWNTAHHALRLRRPTVVVGHATGVAPLITQGATHLPNTRDPAHVRHTLEQAMNPPARGVERQGQLFV
jgi:DNA processing protein